MNYEDFLVRGIDGTGYWPTIRHKVFTHNDMGLELRKCQESASAYRALGLKKESEAWVKNALFMENMMWRVYWFGERSKLAVKPALSGEYHKAMRTNYAFYDDQGRKMGDYWSSRDGLMAKHGEWGCNQEQRIFSWAKVRPCLKIGCRHQGIKEATKVLKKYARRDWERTHLKKYAY